MTEPTVVAAIVTGPGGVLLCRRHDEKPPWTFPAGAQEPGETWEETAVRECREETGLSVTAVKVLGDRVHPKTGRHMAYVACEGSGRPVNGEPDDLSSVEWRTDHAELLAHLFEPVADHLGA